MSSGNTRRQARLHKKLRRQKLTLPKLRYRNHGRGGGGKRQATNLTPADAGQEPPCIATCPQMKAQSHPRGGLIPRGLFAQDREVRQWPAKLRKSFDARRNP
mgnify:CR=1 FL=1